MHHLLLLVVEAVSELRVRGWGSLENYAHVRVVSRWTSGGSFGNRIRCGNGVEALPGCRSGHAHVEKGLFGRFVVAAFSSSPLVSFSSGI